MSAPVPTLSNHIREWSTHQAIQRNQMGCGPKSRALHSLSIFIATHIGVIFTPTAQRALRDAEDIKTARCPFSLWFLRARETCIIHLRRMTRSFPSVQTGPPTLYEKVRAFQPVPHDPSVFSQCLLEGRKSLGCTWNSIHSASGCCCSLGAGRSPHWVHIYRGVRGAVRMVTAGADTQRTTYF